MNCVLAEAVKNSNIATVPKMPPLRRSNLCSDHLAEWFMLGYASPFASLAQLVEQLTLNQRVAGSNPARGIALLLRSFGVTTIATKR